MAHDEQSLAEIAANSALASRLWLQERLGRSDLQVSCVYPFCIRACLCLVCAFLVFSFALFGFCAGYKGPAEERSNVTAKTQLRFAWHMLCEGFSETCDVQLLCRHAIRRGVHLPKAWKRKWHLSADMPPVDALAHEAVNLNATGVSTSTI